MSCDGFGVSPLSLWGTRVFNDHPWSPWSAAVCQIFVASFSALFLHGLYGEERRDTERKGNSLLVSSERDSCSGVQERNFSASLFTAVVRDCNNTDLPHRDVVRLFMCKALGEVQRDEYYYHLI